jgi:hypothetical protein
MPKDAVTDPVKHATDPCIFARLPSRTRDALRHVQPGVGGCASIKGTRREKTSLTTASPGRLVRHHRTGKVHIPHESVAIRPSPTLPATTSERGLLQSAHRQCLRYDSPANDFGMAIETDVASANGRLVTPVEVKSLPVTRKRRTAKPTRITSQQSPGQELEAFLAALSLGALFALILTSIVMKLSVG